MQDLVLQRWRKALKDVSGISSWVFNSATGCGPALQAEVAVLSGILELSDCPVWLHRFEDKLVDEVQAKLLRTFRPHARLPVQHAVGLEQRVAALLQKLQAGKVCRTSC